MVNNRNETVKIVLQLIDTIKEGNLLITFQNGEITQIDSYEKYLYHDDRNKK